MNRRTYFATFGCVALALALLGFGLALLRAQPLPVAAATAATHREEMAVFKKPGISTIFVVSNTAGAANPVEHRYYTYADPATPVYTEVHTLAAGASGTYTVGQVAALPSVFYGRLVLASEAPFTARGIAPPKVIRGRVTYANSLTPVTDARVIAHRPGTPERIEARTDLSGTYHLRVDGGYWLLEVAPLHPMTPTDWIYADPPAEVAFDRPPAHPEVKFQDLRVLAATGHLVGAVDPPIPGVRISARNAQGIGNDTGTNASGAFDLQLPQGQYNVYVHPLTYTYGSLNVHGVLVTESTAVGLVTLPPTTMVITGQVTNGAGNPLDAVPGVNGRVARVVAWERQGPGWGMTETDAHGVYTLPLAVATLPTEWMLRVAPPPVDPGNAPLVAPRAREVILRAGVHRALDVALLPADGRIIGQVVDEDDDPLSLLGRAHALRHPWDAWPARFPAPMYDGTFTLTVPTTHTHNFIYDVGVRPDPASGYAPGYIRNVDPPTSGDVAVSVTLRQRDALIVGALVDGRTWPAHTDVVTGVPARVVAIDQPLSEPAGDWQSRWINMANGGYAMGVVSGTWRMAFRVDRPQLWGWVPDPRFRQDPRLHVHPVASGDAVTVPLPVLPLTELVTGTVRIEELSSGGPTLHPLPYVKVCARGIDPVNRDVRLCTETNVGGRYRLRTTPGHYIVDVRVPQGIQDRGYLPPDHDIVNPSEGDVNFVVRRANATVHGNVTISTTAPLTRPQVLVWAWSENGSHVHAKVPLHQPTPGTLVFDNWATYALSVTGRPAGETWYVGAAYESGGVLYRAPRQRVVVHPGDALSVDLRLRSLEDLLGRMPAPRSVTFDRSLGVLIALDNGATLRVPAGAIPADTDDVTIDIYPLALLPEQRYEEVVGFGYALKAYDGDGVPVTARFLEHVILTLPYDEAVLAALGIAEEDILPAYLSTTTGRWEPPASYVLDTTADRLTLYVDHFTDFAIVGEPSVQVGVQIYLPTMLRTQ